MDVQRTVLTLLGLVRVARADLDALQRREEAEVEVLGEVDLGGVLVVVDLFVGGLIRLEQIARGRVVHVDRGRVGALDRLAAFGRPARPRRRIGHVLQVGVVQGLLGAGIAGDGVQFPAVAAPVQFGSKLLVVGFVDTLLAEHLVLGRGVGDVAQHHHAVVGQGGGVIFVDRLQGRAAGGRIGRRIILVLGRVVAADHGVERQAEVRRRAILQRDGAAPLILGVQIRAVADLVLEDDPVGDIGVGPVRNGDAGVSQQNRRRLGPPGAGRGRQEARHRAEVDARFRVGAVGAAGRREGHQGPEVAPGVAGQEGDLGIDLFGDGVVGALHRTDDPATGVIERTGGRDIDRTGDAAFFIGGARRLLDCHLLDDFRGEDVELDVTTAAARGGGQAVDADEGEIAGQAAHVDALAQAAVAFDGDPWDALQRLG